MRRLWILFIVGAIGVNASQIQEKIQKSKASLQSAELQKRAASRQLSKLAASIRNAENELIALQKKLKSLSSQQKEGEQRYAIYLARIRELDEKIANLDDEIQNRQRRFIELLSDQFATIIAMQKMKRHSEREIILDTYYRRYKEAMDRRLRQLKESINKSRRSKELLMLERAKLKRYIAKLDSLRSLYRNKKIRSEKLLKKLIAEEKVYRKRLRDIISRQFALRQTLAKLNLLRKEEIKAAKRRAAERRARIARQARKFDKLSRDSAAGRSIDYRVINNANVRVKQYGSSYLRERVANYRGPKTFSPIRGARLVKRFGNYVDPIYKIRIFNDSITLRAPNSDATVRSVFNGKVVYVGENSILGKVVILQHGRGLHTIYAGLSKISPVIRNGALIRRGTAVGKVRRKLIFQATQNSRLINPLQLIRL